MAFPRHSLLALLLLAAMMAGAANASTSKLNVPRVLLPLCDEDNSFELFSERGCFKWKSSRPEFVAVTPVGADASGCSSRARVSSTHSSSTPHWTKTQAIITAEDVDSPGHVLRCDVIVDEIRSLQIVTKTHDLYLEEPPEEFAVRAYDEQGNEFSTLEKIVFKWSIENTVKKKSGGSDNIRFINFRDSTYALETAIMAIEDSGRQGSKVLLEGIKTGSSKVSVRLVASAYGKVPPAEVNVMVVANLFIVPGAAFVMVGGRVNYHAEQIRSNKIHAIALPTAQYHLVVGDEKLARLDSESGNSVTGLALGGTEISLWDHNVAPEDYLRPPTAELFVVEPSYITLR